MRTGKVLRSLQTLAAATSEAKPDQQDCVVASLRSQSTPRYIEGKYEPRTPWLFKNTASDITTTRTHWKATSKQLWKRTGPRVRSYPSPPRLAVSCVPMPTLPQLIIKLLWVISNRGLKSKGRERCDVHRRILFLRARTHQRENKGTISARRISSNGRRHSSLPPGSHLLSLQGSQPVSL